MPKTLVVIPTYNERSNLDSIMHRVVAVSGVEVLVVDDNSPDGTGELADALAAVDPRVHVLHRAGKDGLGAAYRAGFAWGFEHGFEYLVEMDGDGSHHPDQLPALIAALDAGADLAIGTRWMPGGEVHNWPTSRRLLSRGGTAFARVMLRSHLRDITSGYRAFRATALRSVDVASVASQGYGFQVELAWRIERAGLTITEVPISFTEREGGSSKMSLGIVLEAMVRVFAWGVADRMPGAAPRRRSVVNPARANRGQQTDRA